MIRFSWFNIVIDVKYLDANREDDMNIAHRVKISEGKIYIIFFIETAV